jgi:Na+-transporting NADH:ubiquinone oxidoreductase subunit NqrD
MKVFGWLCFMGFLVIALVKEGGATMWTGLFFVIGPIIGWIILGLIVIWILRKMFS